MIFPIIQRSYEAVAVAVAAAVVVVVAVAVSLPLCSYTQLAFDPRPIPSENSRIHTVHADAAAAAAAAATTTRLHPQYPEQAPEQPD